MYSYTHIFQNYAQVTKSQSASCRLSNKTFLTVLTSNAELLIFSFDTRDGGICQEVHSEVLNTDLNEPIEGAEQTGRVSDRIGVPIASSTARAAGSQSTVSQSSALRPVSPAIAGQDDDDIHSVDDDSHQNLQTDLPPAQRPWATNPLLSQEYSHILV